MSKHETFRKDIFRFALRAGARGVTTDEMAALFVTVPNCVSGRMTEMKYMGWLLPTDKIRLTRRGKPAAVWRANPEFRWLLKSWKLKEQFNGKSPKKISREKNAGKGDSVVARGKTGKAA
jgi:hypothetical protein